ncbi:EST1-like protein A [Exophiala viscosa]|uniref:EST1-like protein A n=1 Tax=Exophiala viscosa TaxID=2486360 RepID=A0AAN6DU44_9EURO|nr:EST1-like protein A [Exophiala viscosa]
METFAEQATKNVDRTEKDVLASLKQKETAYSSLEQRLAKFRLACQDFMFVDFAAAAQKKTESRLWDAHSKVNKKFRQFLAQFREGDGKKKHVERRKAEKLYLEFIKSSMRFYRGYIQRLASHFSDVPEVFEIARKFNLDTESADTPQPVDTTLKGHIVRSCYLTLIQLGDLSRYRETELQSKERNWGPAKGYYDLATALDPTSGMSYNQLAVIALTDQDHLRAVYYLYRAICVDKPAPLAPGNLDLEFKKVRTKSNQGKLFANGDVAGDGSLALQDRFLLFHARCVDKDFNGYEDHQAEIHRLLADELREKPFDTIIRKFCLINIAAEQSAGQKVHDDSFAIRSFEILQHFNISTFFMLLKLLLDELQRLAKHPDRTTETSPDDCSHISPVTRRILPHLRVYSGWLLSTVHLLLANKSLSVQVSELWQAYAEALTLLRQTFSILDVQDIPYLLEEDQDTVAFTAFSECLRRQRFQNSSHQSKPSYSEAVFGQRSVENEMLHRIKGLVKDGMYLCRREGDFESISIPMIFAGMRFVYSAQGEAHPGDAADSSLQAHSSANGLSREDIERARTSINAAIQRSNQYEDTSEAGAASMTSTMENMVNNLTKHDGPDMNTVPTTVFHEHAARSLGTPLGHSPAERRASGMLPPSMAAFDPPQPTRHSIGSLPGLHDRLRDRSSLPSIWNTPFTPRPDDISASSPRPSTAHRTSAALAPSTLNSPAMFQADILQLQEQIQNRSSPPQSFQPTMSSHYETPTHLTSWIRNIDQLQPSPSPFQASSAVAAVQGTVIPTRSPEPSPFGAIGEPRAKSRAPTSGQAG